LPAIAGDAIKPSPRGPRNSGQPASCALAVTVKELNSPVHSRLALFYELLAIDPVTQRYFASRDISRASSSAISMDCS
jgi:hypothetical protein